MSMFYCNGMFLNTAAANAVMNVWLLYTTLHIIFICSQFVDKNFVKFERYFVKLISDIYLTIGTVNL